MLLIKTLILLSVPFMAFSTPKQNPAKVVVVGAGIAGLTTAYRLQQQGLDVEVYEARGRVGGRVFTIQVDGELGELGGQNLYDGGEPKNLSSLIDETRLEVQKDAVLLDHAYFDGEKVIPSTDLYPLFDPDALQEQLSVIRKESTTMLEVLSSLFEPNDPVFKCLSVRLAGYEGATIEQLSSHYTETLQYMLLGGICVVHQEKTVRFATIKGGNSLLPERLATALGSRVYLNKSLMSLSRTTDDGYTLVFHDGNVVKADILVLAIPCSVYGDIHFQEGLIPQDTLTAIRSINYGTNAKILISVAEVPTQKINIINDRMGAYFKENSNILTCYYTGKYGRFSADSITDLFEQGRPMLEMGYSLTAIPTPILARDESFVHYQGSVGYSWPNDPYVKGSYSYIAPGQETLFTALTEVDGETVKKLFEPIENSLYFAGEHATILHNAPGTMEAACESGERAARMIVDARRRAQ